MKKILFLFALLTLGAALADTARAAVPADDGASSTIVLQGSQAMSPKARVPANLDLTALMMGIPAYKQPAN